MGCGASKEGTAVVQNNNNNNNNNATKTTRPPSLQAPETKPDTVAKPKLAPLEQPVKRQQKQPPSPPSSNKEPKERTVDKTPNNGEPDLKFISEPSLGFPSSVAVYKCCPDDGESAEEEDEDDSDYGDNDKDDDMDDNDKNDNDKNKESKPLQPPQPPTERKIPKRPTVVRQPSDGHVKAPVNPPKRGQSQNKKKKKKKTAVSAFLDSSMDATHHLRNIFAAPFSIKDVASFRPPKFDKPDSERAFIKKALKTNFIFGNLSSRQMETILDAMERVQYQFGERIIQQGDDGDYFYVIRRGMLHYQVDGIFVGNASDGQTFGELALIYTSPRAASVISDSDCILYRVDQSTFRYILQTQTEQTEKDKRALLEGIPFLKDLDTADLDKLAAAMVPRRFMAGENIARKGEDATAFYVIQEGKVRVKNLEIGGTTYEDHDLGPGAFFGESTLLANAPRAAHLVGKTEGFALSIDKETFTEVLGDYGKLITKSADKKRLAGIRIIKNSYLSAATLSALASSMVEKRFPPNSCVIAEDVYTPAALYLVRSGSVQVKERGERNPKIIEKGGYFGEDMLLADLDGVKSSTMVVSSFTVSTLDEPTTLSVLTLEACREFMDTSTMGSGHRFDYTSIVDSNIPLKELKRHTILGAGTFGQVWLVSKMAPDGTNRPYALKIQAKHDLVKNEQVKGVVNERNIMARLKHPFLLRLVQTYTDQSLVYMLLGLVQGGELYTVIHQRNRGGLGEESAKFYSACIFEALAYMHRRQIVYRDLKPENVLIDFQGYPVVVDFGFAKQIESKTFTLCGTPLYIAPEVILNQGHDYACDHWSWAVLTYEMMTGRTPFHRKGMDQITLFRAIANNSYKFPTDAKVMSLNAKDLIKRILVLNQRKRLGSLAGGVDDVFAHKWFQEIDFAVLRRKEVQAPWLPNIKDPLDASKFQQWHHLEDMTKKNFPPISAKIQKMFDDF